MTTISEALTIAVVLPAVYRSLDEMQYRRNRLVGELDALVYGYRHGPVNLGACPNALCSSATRHVGTPVHHRDCDERLLNFQRASGTG